MFNIFKRSRERREEKGIHSTHGKQPQRRHEKRSDKMHEGRWYQRLYRRIPKIRL